MKLVSPSANYEASYRQYIEELGNEERYPFPMDFDHADFEALIQKLSNFAQGKNLPEGFVPSSTLWLVDETEIVGVTNIRHYLNDRITHCGGHIGLGIRPKYRGKGYGKLLMKLSIQRLQEMSEGPVHIHCHKENSASANTIKACGGLLDSEIEADGKIVQRYLVKPGD
ncbi:GNAT family N-acetyltransferase [Microbulbifer sp. THAF38]|uniref:GNAT family N-acetyltransferase n=1 Tax=Microbulbifer sp. THAF38 TaxID=2587856 RepID=UPI00126932DF|nr:GNAT family N-acetyltransferase [Microbulbifer sp. THAF38]QFT55024.1 Acetyltransferase (GNAT) family protein [Microbulbifer sp. THAF38]